MLFAVILAASFVLFTGCSLDGDEPGFQIPDPVASQSDEVAVEFTGAILTYFGDYYYSGAGNFILELYEGELTSGGLQSYLYVDCFSEYFEEHDEAMLGDGTYHFTKSNDAYTFRESAFTDVRRYSDLVVTSGNFTLVRYGDFVSIETKMRLDDGRMLCGTYEGRIDVLEPQLVARR